MANQEERRMIKMLWSMVSKAAERSRRQKHDTFRDPVAFMEIVVDVQKSRFSGMMLAVVGLVWIK